MSLRTICVAGLLSVVPIGGGATVHAQLAPLRQTAQPTSADDLASDSAQAEVAGDHDKALKLADKAIRTDPKNPWATYDRGDALSALRRPDDAVVAFQQAEQRYGNAEMWGKSIAIWGEANAFSQVGRCQEAVPIFDRYATFVEAVDKAAAALARQYAKQCTARPAAPNSAGGK